jgi:hypothetical protein
MALGPKMKTLAVMIVLLCAGTPVVACSFDKPPEFTDVVKSAKQIFVLQIISEDLSTRRSFDRPVIEGHIRVMGTLKGTPVEFTRVDFNNSTCGGVRLDVGQFYVAFTNQTGSVLKLIPADNSLIPLANEYIPELPVQNYRYKFLRSVREFAKGAASAESIDPYPLIERNGTQRRVNCDPCGLGANALGPN